MDWITWVEDHFREVGYMNEDDLQELLDSGSKTFIGKDGKRYVAAITVEEVVVVDVEAKTSIFEEGIFWTTQLEYTEGPQCKSYSGYSCTLALGHEGDHIGHGTRFREGPNGREQIAFARWK